VGLPRYLAATCVDDLERTLALADDLIPEHERSGGIALLQSGRESSEASVVAKLVKEGGRRAVPIVVKNRAQAQSEALLAKLDGVSAVWVFADNLFDTFMNLFATQLAFELRAVAKRGMPVVGIGGGALALGSLLVANRVCGASHYDLVGGLGWAPRVFVDAGANRGSRDGALARSTVRSLPGLLGIDLGLRGGVRVAGGRVESIGDEPIVLLGGDEHARLHMLSLDPGQMATIAPPPFAPFDRGLMPLEMTEAIKLDVAPARPPEETPTAARQPEEMPPLEAVAADGEARFCPMCGKVH
jgi:hypothetical protein